MDAHGTTDECTRHYGSRIENFLMLHKQVHDVKNPNYRTDEYCCRIFGHSARKSEVSVGSGFRLAS